MNQPLEPLRDKKFRPTHRKSILRSWPVHNLIAHPLSEIAWWLVRPFGADKAERLSNWIHDSTVPKEPQEPQ